MIALLKKSLLLIALLPAMAVAQKAPGYLGKRFSVEYNAYLFPSFFNPNSPDAEPKSEEDDLAQKGVSINLQHHIIGQWSFSKKASLVGSIGLTNTNYLPQRYPYSDIRFVEYPSLTALSYEAGIRIFTQHYAPLGKFVEFRLGLATVKTDDFTYSAITQNTSGQYVQKVYTVEGGSMTWPTVAMALGTNRVIKDIVILSYGVDFNFFPGGFGHYVNVVANAPRNEFRDYEEGNTTSNQEALLSMAGARYAIQCAVNLRIGVGILL